MTMREIYDQHCRVIRQQRRRNGRRFRGQVYEAEDACDSDGTEGNGNGHGHHGEGNGHEREHREY